ncbi:MAG: hypothetical protein RLO10_10195 [Roseovarius indicus]
MTRKVWCVLARTCTLPVLSACAPLIGAGAVVAADEIAEQENNDEGLF